MLTFTLLAKAGGSGEGPENTCSAIASSLAVRPPSWARMAIEVDVRLSADERVVVIHDARLDRTTSGRGLVRHASFERLRHLEAGPRGERIPALEEVLELAREHELVVDVHDSSPRMARALVASLRRAAGPRQRVIVASEHGQIVRAVRALAPGVPTAATPRAAWCALLLTHLRGERWLPRGHCWMVPASQRGVPVVTPRFASGATRSGDELWVYVVDEAPAAERLRRLGATGVFTTRPASLAAALG